MWSKTRGAFLSRSSLVLITGDLKENKGKNVFAYSGAVSADDIVLLGEPGFGPTT